jgi:DNA-binding NarL/FixJ family response regulator
MPEKCINLAIASDHVILGKALKIYLAGLKDIKVALICLDKDILVKSLKESSIDVLLLSMVDPGSTGTGTLRILRNELPELRILLLSSSTDPAFLSTFLELEIYGYISSRDEPEGMINAIKLASDDKIYKTNLFTEAMYLNKKSNLKYSSLKENARLSDRERNIIRLLWEEKSNKEIASELFLSIRSVEKIRQNIKNKLGVKSTIGMLKYLIK